MKAREYALGLLEEWTAELNNMEEGGRNDALNRTAFKLGGLVQPDALEEAEVREKLETVALATGLLLGEIRATLDSGLKAGMTQPLDLSRFERPAQWHRARRQPTAAKGRVSASPSTDQSKCRPLTESEIQQARHALKPVVPGSPAQQLLARRGLPDSSPTLTIYQNAQGHLVFEVRGPDSQPWAFKVRTDRKEGQRYSYLTKTVGAPAWTSLKYGQRPSVLLVEGELNAAAACFGLEAQGLFFDVQGMAGTSGKPHLEGLQGKDVYSYADAGKVGQDAAYKWAGMALEAGAASVTLLPSLPALEGQEQDFCDVLGRQGSEALGEALAGLLRAGKPHEAASAALPASASHAKTTGAYEVQGGSLIWHKPTREGGTVPVPLANFSAYITAETVKDDGAEQTYLFTLEGQLAGGRGLPTVDIPAAQFTALSWVPTAWGASAIIKPGQATKDHLRAAIQELSSKKGIAARKVYAYTGWLLTEHGWVYLHSGGAIGAQGQTEELEVDLSGSLARYRLPAPLAGLDLHAGIRATLGVLDVAPLEVSGPLLAGLWRSVLTSCDFALWLVGETGQGKSEFAALLQQHFGQEMDARHFPGNWSSTANSLEALTFATKDALTVIDDFAPKGSVQDMARYHSTADRVLRAQGNNAGRGRMTAQGTLRPEKTPRGLILATGEDVSKGHSARARALILEFPKNGMQWQALATLQSQARSGVFAGVMAAYLQWLAPQLEKIQAQHSDALAKGREVFTGASHPRTPGIAADLFWGAETFLTFAEEVGALTESQVRETLARLLEVLQRVVKSQGQHHEAADPVARFLEVLWSLLESGQAHLKDAKTSETPTTHPSRYGWQPFQTYDGQAWRQGGLHLGWVGDEGIYLIPEAAFSAVATFLSRQGEAIPMSSKTLWKRMSESGLLRQGEKDRNTVKVTLGSLRRSVIHILAGGYAQIDGTTGTTGADTVPDSLEPVPFPTSERDTPQKNRDTPAAQLSEVALCPESQRDTLENRDTLDTVADDARPGCPDCPASPDTRGNNSEAPATGQEITQSW